MKKYIGLLICAIPASSFAVFCPGNFKQINIGDTVDQVKLQCGSPAKEEVKEVTPDGPQQWSYLIPQSVGMSPTAQAQGTLQTSFTFDASGKAVNISVNGIGVGATTICGSNIQLGDDIKKVKQACGEPALTNKQNDVNKVKPISEVTYTYNTTPPVKLIFNDGVLKEIQ